MLVTGTLEELVMTLRGSMQVDRMYILAGGVPLESSSASFATALDRSCLQAAETLYHKEEGNSLNRGPQYRPQIYYNPDYGDPKFRETSRF